MIAKLASDFAPADMDQWRGLVDKALKGGDFERRLVARTSDGIRIQPLYAARPASSDWAFSPPAREGWDIRQIQASEDPAATNAAILEDLAGGASSVLLQIASPGWGGLPYYESDIGRALEGVLLDICPVALHAGEYTPDAAGSLIAIWNSRGVTADQRLGALNYDPIGTLAATGALYHPFPRAVDVAAGLVRQTLPWAGVTALRANGHVWHAAGASEAQELAGVLSTVVCYLRAAEAAGMAPAVALPKIAITLAADADQLMGLAKFRAIRRLLGRLADACQAHDAAACVSIAAETSTTMMTRRDPWVNMLRTTMACATAAWGGADAITVLPFTWGLGQPDAFARRMARNTSIVLMEESGLGRVADPSAGSFAIESLTDDLAKAAWKTFQDIEAGGGIAASLQSGAWQAALAGTAKSKQTAIATGRQALTGTSAFPKLGNDGVSVAPWPSVGAKALELNGVRVAPLIPFRPSASFEALRDAADAFAERTGAPPRIALICLGPLAAHATRATWTTNFLAAGGIAVTQSGPVLASQTAGTEFQHSGAAIACVCGADDSYGALGDAVVSLLKTAGAKKIYVAGRPKDLEANLRAAGVDGFIFAGADMIDVLAMLHADLGVAKGAV